MSLTGTDGQWIRARSFPKDFPERLERLKELSGLSWRELAERVGVTPSRVSGWRRGRVPRGFALLNLARFAVEVEGGFETLFPEMGVTVRLRGQGE